MLPRGYRPASGSWDSAVAFCNWRRNPVDTLVKLHVGHLEPGGRVFRLIVVANEDMGRPRADLGSVPLSSFPDAHPFLTPPQFRQRFAAVGELNQTLPPFALLITHASVAPNLLVAHTE